MASAPFSTAAFAPSQSPAGASSSGRAEARLGVFSASGAARLISLLVIYEGVNAHDSHSKNAESFAASAYTKLMNRQTWKAAPPEELAVTLILALFLPFIPKPAKEIGVQSNAANHAQWCVAD